MHNGHGWDPPLPLVDDYCDPSRQYSNPRSLNVDVDVPGVPDLRHR